MTARFDRAGTGGAHGVEAVEAAGLEPMLDFGDFGVSFTVTVAGR